MSEGGIFPWRVQKIRLPKNGRPGNYANISRPLPDPPKDQIWVQDANTREWKLVPLAVATAAAAATADDLVEEECNVASATITTAVAPTLDANSDQPTIPATESTTNDDGFTATTAIPIPLPTVEVAIPIDRSNSRNIIMNIGNEAPSFDNNGNRYHEIQTTDTFQGICLRYKVTPTELRRANKMVLMDSNLTLHTKLVIPSSTATSSFSSSSSSSPMISKKKQHQHGVDQGEAEKIATLLSKISSYHYSSSSSSHSRSGTTSTKVSYSEARAYLEIEDWDVNRAMESVCEDFGWSTPSAT